MTVYMMEKPIASEGPHDIGKIWSKDFILICIANFFIFLGFQMTLPTIPLFIEELGGNDQLIGLVVGIFTFAALILRPIAGHALESKGRALVYLTGLAIFVLSVGSYAFTLSIAFLFIMRIIQGAGWGFSTTASGTIATDLIPVQKRGEGLGYFGLSGNLAMAIGPSLGLILAEKLSFNILFLICASFGFIALLLSLMVTYKKVERRERQLPIKRLDFYEKSALKPSWLIMFITVTFGGIATFLPLYSIENGVTGIQLYFLLYALALMLTRTFAGKLYDKKGHRAVFIPGALLILAAMLLLSWLPNNTVLYTAALLYGTGFGAIQPALQAWSVAQAPANRRGMANATFFSFFDLGIGVGAIIFGQIGHSFGYSIIYLASALSIFLSILSYLFFLVKEAKTSFN
jgi:MFS family permease